MTKVAQFRPMTILNAEIKTTAVEIKTLTVSGKQVTLAVFRQLKEERLVNRDGSLNGVAWGIVNYHPDKCADSSPHIHVVWQRGTELLRSTVWLPTESVWYTRDSFLEDEFGQEFWTDSGDEALTISIFRDITEQREPAQCDKDGFVRRRVALPKLGFSTWQKAHPLTKLAVHLYRHERKGRDQLVQQWQLAHDFPDTKIVLPAEVKLTQERDEDWEDYQKRQAAANPSLTYRSVLNLVMRQLSEICSTYGDAEEKFKQEMFAECEVRKSYISAVDAVGCLPQLFIAV